MSKSYLLCSLVLSSAVASLSAQTPVSAAPTPDADKPRVYVTDSNSWQISGSGGGGGGAFASHQSGGARPQTAEIIKTFGQRCSQVIINNRVDVSDYVVELDHEGGKGMLAHKDKVAVFVRRSGDSIFSKSTLSVGGAVQDSCASIVGHWGSHAKELVAPAGAPAPSVVPTVTVMQAAERPKLNVSSQPPGADIEINGSFAGNTPSLVEVDAGDIEVKVSKKGFGAWSRKVKVKGGTINLSAELEPASP